MSEAGLKLPLQLKRMAAAAGKLVGLRKAVADFAPKAWGDEEIVRQCDMLLARRGEPWATSIATEILARFSSAEAETRNAFLAVLAERYGADAERLDRAIEIYQRERDAMSMADVHAASESRREQLIQELSQAPGGTLTLLRMREHGLSNRKEIASYDALDADFRQVLASWFNRSLLTLKRIDWSSPANVLRKIIDYEAVHEIQGWEDLRRRVEPSDRRCYAFFHPQLSEEPLIFVEVALTAKIPTSIQSLLSEGQAAPPPSPPTTAVFYSISNCQEGLRGVPFGNFLIKQTAELLQRELPSLKTFVTLSPVPSFAAWLERQRADDQSELLRPEEREQLALLDDPEWVKSPEPLAELLPSLLARYLIKERGKGGRPADPVARFHLGNGAELAYVQWLADISPRGLKQSHGLMVNYLYDLKHIEQNQAALIARGEVAASGAVQRLAKLPRRAELIPQRLAFSNHR